MPGPFKMEDSALVSHYCVQKLKNDCQSFCACVCHELLFGAKSHKLQKNRAQMHAWYVCSTIAQLLAQLLA